MGRDRERSNIMEGRREGEVGKHDRILYDILQES